jgi:predicted anti-sigma-YlaC factor YlaD
MSGCHRHIDLDSVAALHNEDLDLYLDGELLLIHESTLFRHLSQCAECRDYLNGVLAFRRISREEFLEVPLRADDRLLARIEGIRQTEQKTARLHTHDSLWSARATVSVRSLVLAFGAVLVSAVILSGLGESSPGYVLTEQERVHFDQTPSIVSEVYVFYPGLTVEAERETF